MVKLCLYACVSVVYASVVAFFMAGGVGGEEIWHHHCCLCAAPTLVIVASVSAHLVVLRVLQAANALRSRLNRS